MDESSRYANVGTAEVILPDGRHITVLRRRWLPQPEDMQQTGIHTVEEGERLDNITAEYLGDPTKFWQLCDANGALHPEELEKCGKVLRIALPPGVSTGTTIDF